MPLYEYRCVRNCQVREFVPSEVTEARRSISDRNNTPPCKNCGGDTELVVSVPAVAQVRGGTGAQRYDAGKR